MWTFCQTTVFVVSETLWTSAFHIILVTNNQQEAASCDKWQLPSHISLLLNSSNFSTVILLCSVTLTFEGASHLRCSTQTEDNEFLPEVISGPLPPSTHGSLWATTQRSPEFFYSLLVTSLGGNLTVALKAAFFSGTGTEQGCWYSAKVVYFFVNEAEFASICVYDVNYFWELSRSPADLE